MLRRELSQHWRPGVSVPIEVGCAYSQQLSCLPRCLSVASSLASASFGENGEHFCFCGTRRSKLVSGPLVWTNIIATCARWLMEVQEPSPPELGENHQSLRCESLAKHWFVSRCFEEDSAVSVSVFFKHYCYLELEHWQVQRLIFGLQSLQPGSITMGFPEFLAIAYLPVNFNLVYSLFFILKSCQNFSVGHNLFWQSHLHFS